MQCREIRRQAKSVNGYIVSFDTSRFVVDAKQLDPEATFFLSLAELSRRLNLPYRRAVALLQLGALVPDFTAKQVSLFETRRIDDLARLIARGEFSQRIKSKRLPSC